MTGDSTSTNHARGTLLSNSLENVRDRVRARARLAHNYYCMRTQPLTRQNNIIIPIIASLNTPFVSSGM